MNRKAKALAKEIVAWHEFVPKIDPKCIKCHGTGTVTGESCHNGDLYEESCDCQYAERDRLDFWLSKYDDAVYELAKHYLKESK